MAKLRYPSAMEKLKGKNVLITGASSGIGEALAREFARHGANLALAARRVERLESLAKELSTQGKAIAISCDVTHDGDLEKAVERCHAELGDLDVVVANAGFGVVGGIEELSIEDFRRQFETNIFGVLRTVRATLNDLKKTHGRLAILGSVSGYAGMPGNAPYTMSKFAVRGLCECLTPELKKTGVSVTHIAPGFVNSEIRQVDNRGIRHAGAKDPLPDWLRMPTDKAAKKMVRAIACRRRERVVTGHGHILVWLVRFFPWLFHLLVNAIGVSARSEPKKKRPDLPQ